MAVSPAQVIAVGFVLAFLIVLAVVGTAMVRGWERGERWPWLVLAFGGGGFVLLMVATAAMFLLVKVGPTERSGHFDGPGLTAVAPSPRSSTGDTELAGDEAAISDITSEPIATKEADTNKPPSHAKPSNDWTDWSSGELHWITDHYEMMVHAGPYSTHAECVTAMDHELVAAVDSRAGRVLGPAGAESGTALDFIRDSLSAADIQRYLVIDVRDKVHSRTLVPGADEQTMHDLYAHLVFDDVARAKLEALWRQADVRARLWWAGGGLAVALAGLSLAWGVLRRETKNPASTVLT